MHWWVPEGSNIINLEELKKSDGGISSYASRRDSLPRLIFGKTQGVFSLSCFALCFSTLCSVLRLFFFLHVERAHTERVHRGEKQKVTVTFHFTFLTFIRENCNGKFSVNVCPSELKFCGS